MNTTNSDVTRPLGPVVIDIENITKDYVMGEETVRALRGVSLQIHSNEYVAIMGPSGSGKSTLMNMFGCLDTPTSGRYEFNGKNVAAMDDDELAAIRNREIGFVFKHLTCSRAPPVCATLSFRSSTQEWIRKRAKNARPRHLSMLARATESIITQTNYRGASASAWPSPARRRTILR